MTGELQPQLQRFEKVLICSGHMIDDAQRKEPRFPAAKAESVRAAIARQLNEWNVLPDDLAISGGASGADTIFAEECLRRGAKLRLLLAQKRDDFVRESVAPAGAEWVRRFEALCQKADVATLPDSFGGNGDDLSIYERNNLWIMESARRAAEKPQSIHALLVWDEQPTGDGPGGTSDFEKRVREFGGRIAIINPIKLPPHDGHNL